MQAISLYTYHRSSAAYRVRIALNIKQLNYQSETVHLVNDGGQQHGEAYCRINPQQLVPTYRQGEQILTQSLAIIEYLDETQPEPSLLPASPLDRAYVRALAQSIACDIHPLDNLRVLQYLENAMGQDKAARQRWYCHWISQGFLALEQTLADKAGSEASEGFCFGSQPSLADICLIPQVYNALRFNCAIGHYPRIQHIYEHCMARVDFQQAAPEQQADFVET